MVENIDKLRKEILEYIEVKVDIVRVHTAENLARLLSNSTTFFIVGYLLFFIFMFLSFAAGYYIGTQLHSNEAGFMCVAGFYLAVLIIFLIFRRQIVERPIIQAVVKMLFPKFSDDEK